VRELETDIHRLEAELKGLEHEISTASEAQQAMRLHELGSLYSELERQLQHKLDQWAELA
jgi:hypothetical protein